MSEDRDWETVAIGLYSRKLSRKAFNSIRKRYDQMTKGNLCAVVNKGLEATVAEIKRLSESTEPKDKLKLRTELYRLIDYDTYHGFC